MVGRATPAQIKKALEHHGIGHMSASTCNSVINGGMAWFVAQKVYGVRDNYGVAAERGKAVEAAIMEYLMDRNLSVEHVIERAIEVFEAATQGADEAELETERGYIVKMVILLHKGMAEYPVPDFQPGGRQKKVLTNVEGVTAPFLGFLDVTWGID